MKYFILLFSTLQLSLLLCNAQVKTSLTAAEFEKGISLTDSVQLLDVRTPSEYYAGHLKNALLADWNDEKEFTRRLGFIDKNKPVYVYCLAGGRSARAAKKMRENGYENVYELSGGINAWKAASKEVEGNKNEKELTPEELNAVIEKNTIVLIDFGAEWCPPCKKMEPIVKNLQLDHPGIFTLFKIDGGRDQALLKKYDVTTLPVFILFKNGKQVWRKEGMAEEKEMATFF